MKLHTLSSYSLWLLSLLVLASFSSCSKDDDGANTDTTDYADLIADVANNVIVNTYTELATNADALATAVSTLESNPSEANLAAAKSAWVNTRRPWEQSEGFLFGPVDTEAIDPSLDSWPVNQVDLENVLASNNALTRAYVDGLEGTLKGFHTIEFLLWGAEGTKTIDQFDAREFEYLAACSEVLADDANQLANLWLASGGNFVSNLLNAGESGSLYISQKSVLEELVTGIVGIADEVGNGKINDPLAQEDFSLEESQFSDNSKSDFADNIRSIQHVYEGLNGKGLSDVVSGKNADLDAQIKTEIQAAIDAILNIPGTFTEAIPANSPTRAAAEQAQEAVRTLQATLEGNLVSLISNL